MGKRDAFGNEIEENPLDAMGWKAGDPAPPPASVGGVTASSGSPIPTMPPAPPAPPAMPAAPRLSPTMPTQLPNIPGGSSFDPGRWIGRGIGLIIFLAIFGGIGVAVYSAVDTADKVRRTFSIPSFTTPTVSIPSTSTPGTSQTPSKPAQPPAGLQKGSLVRAGEFGKALVAIRKIGGRATNMRIDPTRISANVIGADGLLRIASVTWDGNVQDIKTSSDQSSAQSVSLSTVSSKAPARALARSAGLLGRPARNFNYMVLLNFAGKPQWVVYFKDGKYVRASLDGRSVQRVN
ncbi:MAG TPA: hypothetical protein VFZ89_02015 [Solirubrobacteraceae bacterium]